MEKKKLNRRDFSRTIVKTVLGGACLPLVLELRAEAQEDGQVLRIDLQDEQYAVLNRIGGGVKIEVDWLDDPVIITRVDETTFAAFSSICTHFGCEVELPNEEGIIDCFCHGTRFDLRGHLIDGPALSDLPTFPFEVVRPSAVQARTWGQIKDGSR